MENKEIELTDEEFIFIKSLKDKLNTTEYNKLIDIIERYIQLARNKNREAKHANDRYQSLSERNEANYNKIQEEKEQKEKWKDNYNDICYRYAKLEIELDVTKAKIKILEGEKK